MTITRTTTSRASAEIAARQEFTTSGALSGAWHAYSAPLGMLPEPHRSELIDTLSRAQGAVYIVMSYSTPIAWYEPDAGVWRRPNVKYSVTTSKHQGRCPVDGTEGWS